MKSLKKPMTVAALCLLGGLFVGCENLNDLSGKKEADSDFYKVAMNTFYPAKASESIKVSSAKLKKDRKGYPTYPDEVRHRYVRTTAYSHMENEPGAPSNFNAAGTRLKYTSTVRSAAADWSVYPLGTKIKIKGLPQTYVVDDYGSALVGTNTLDIYHTRLSTMRKWGTRPAEIQVVQWGSWERSAKILKGRRGYKHCRKMYTNLVRKIKDGVIARTTGEAAGVSLKALL